MIPSVAPFTFVYQVTKKLNALISPVRQLLSHNVILVKNGTWKHLNLMVVASHIHVNANQNLALHTQSQYVGKCFIKICINISHFKFINSK